MIKKRIKKIIKLGVLISVRQFWGLMCNLYLLSYQPFLTIKNLLDKRDKSQIFLLTATFISPILLYATARLVWDHYKYGQLLDSVGMVFAIVSIIELLVFLYLSYWIFRVFKAENEQR